jgi:3-oxoacyl-[acyl-carrier protein] reductase
MKIDEAKVIVTGATSGIGYEIARVLKEAGANVVISGRNAAKVEAAAKKLGVYGFTADVSKETDVANLFSFAVEKMKSINVLINNAGIGKFSSLADTSVTDFQEVWETNVKGLFLAGKEAAKHFIAHSYGHIINIGSTASLRGYANGSAYVASKFAVSGLTECWRAELRPHNIRVMQINPSEVITDFIAKAGMEVKNQERKLQPSHIAHVALSMLSMNDLGFIPDASVWATNPW